jgi:transcriptional regulator with PAS, ATPase and Fis domain
MEALRGEIIAAAPMRSSVLILGETGTGKGLIARTMHQNSPWRGRPWVHVDCAALSPNLIESELFGHERGAFTGAGGLRKGRFELAEDGTIFLDEIGDLDLPLQAKLLRVLEEREYERVGGGQTLRMKARVLAATSRDLAQAVRDRCFRRDLYYRLNVIQLRVPPLRERVSDIPLLVRAGLERLSDRLELPVPRVANAFYGRLMAYNWPGNVRELMNLLERCLVHRRVATLEAEDLDGLLEDVCSAPAARGTPQEQERPVGSESDPEVITRVLVEAGGNVTRAARRLGIPRGTLRYRICQLGLESLIPKD